MIDGVTPEILRQLGKRTTADRRRNSPIYGAERSRSKINFFRCPIRK